jgi:hypothetical protein
MKRRSSWACGGEQQRQGMPAVIAISRQWALTVAEIGHGLFFSSFF